MKNLIFVTFFFFSIAAFSQDYLDKIAIQTCDCFSSMSSISDSLSSDQRNLKFGLCMIDAAEPYKKQLKKEYNIDLDQMDSPTGERLGRLVGVKVAGKCPDVILNLQQETVQKSKPANMAATNTFTGVITRIETNGFVTFNIKDEMGKTTTFYWLEFIQCEKDLPAIYTSLTGKLVSVSYKTKEYFEPKLNEYRQYFCLTSLQIIGN